MTENAYTIFALPDLVVPHANIYGSGENELIAGQVRIIRAYRALIETLQRELPHGRDYAHDDDHYRQARDVASKEIKIMTDMMNRHEAHGLDIRQLYSGVKA